MINSKIFVNRAPGLLLSTRRAGDIDRLLQQLQAVPRYVLATGTVAIVLFFCR